MKKVLIMISVMVISVVLSGCASQGQVSSTESLCIPGSSAEGCMEAASDALKSVRFEIEKYDEKAGYIRTRPLSGGQFFEFWKHDNASAYAAAQSNFQSVQRTVEIEISPRGSETCVRCSVQVKQLSVPERPICSMLLLPRSMTEASSKADQALMMTPERAAQVEWLDAGYDRALESKILRKIKNKLKKDV